MDKLVVLALLAIVFSAACITAPKTLEQCEQQRRALSKELCYAREAKRLGDVSLCSNIPNETSKVQCIVKITGETRLCSELEDSHGKDSCLWDSAITNTDSLLCSQIAGSHNKNMCHWDMARILRNAKECDRINDDQTAEWCRKSVALP